MEVPASSASVGHYGFRKELGVKREAMGMDGASLHFTYLWRFAASQLYGKIGHSALIEEFSFCSLQELQISLEGCDNCNVKKSRL